MERFFGKAKRSVAEELDNAPETKYVQRVYITYNTIYTSKSCK